MSSSIGHSAGSVPRNAASTERAVPGTKTWPFVAPSVIVLLAWMIVPLAMTIWFSMQRYNLMSPANRGFVGFDNYAFLLANPSLLIAIWNTVLLVGVVLAATVVFGIALALMLDLDFYGRSFARVMVIAPFFVMPTVSALVWKNLLMHPVNGFFAWVTSSLGLGAIDWFTSFPLLSIAMIVAWQWVPFATLILLTAVQSLDRQQLEAARMDGARGWALFWFIMLPHLFRPIAVIVMIESIFLLQVFAEILVTTSGGPGNASTNLTFLIYIKALLQWDIGGASAGAILAIVLANVVAVFLIRTVAKNLGN